MPVFNIKRLTFILFFLAATVSCAQDMQVKIHMIGNSTMADKVYTPENPEKGWGQVFPLYFTRNVSIENYAMNGRSTKSFIDEGRWDSVLNKVSPGDFLIIEFGHNDAKKEDPKRFAAAHGTYKKNLEKFVTESRGKGAIPILATPINRRSFDSNGVFTDTHGDYPGVVRAIADSMQVPLLDLHKLSRELFSKLGVEGTKNLFVRVTAGEYARFPESKIDDTHFNANGAFRICDLAIREIRLKVPGIVPYLKK